MSQGTLILQTKLGARKGAAVIDRAKTLGLSPKAYLAHLVEEDLAKSASAQVSLNDILGPSQPVDEQELDLLVDEIKLKHRRAVRRKRSK